MDNIDFIEDKDLKKTIEESVEYIYVLFEESKKSNNSLYKEETFRVIILYIISIIEAILFYLYEKRGDKITFIEYKFVKPLGSDYSYKNEKGSLVLAVQKESNKSEHEIGIYGLVKFYENQNFILKKTAKSILELNDIRNTFHFKKPRHLIKCDEQKVEFAISLLLYIIKRAPKKLSNKLK